MWWQFCFFLYVVLCTFEMHSKLRTAHTESTTLYDRHRNIQKCVELINAMLWKVFQLHFKLCEAFEMCMMIGFFMKLFRLQFTVSISSHSHSPPFFSVSGNNKKKTITTKNDDVEAIAFSRYENYTTPYMSHIHTTIKHFAADLRK